MDTAEAQSAEVLKGTQYLSFFVGDEEYAIGILRVKEIIEYGNVTRVPTMPPWIRGVTNVRGSVVPVVDLSAKFGFPSAEAGKTTCVIILEVQLEGEPTTMGVVVGSVSQVIDLLPQHVEPTPAFGTRVRPDFLLGMGKWGSDFVLLVDIDKVLSLKELLGTGGPIELEQPTANGTATSASRSSGTKAAQGV